MRGLKDKVVLITGAAGGIGQAIVARFLDEGARIIALDRDKDGLESLHRRFPLLNRTVICDVANPAEVNMVFKSLETPDILINNAGISLRHAFLEIEAEEWQQVMAVNLNGVFFIAQQVAKKMLKRISYKSYVIPIIT